MKTNFEKLTPKNDIENLDIYEDSLNFVFENDDLRNIAISGAYCAGKSSMLESYKRKNKDKRKFIKISFADFKGKGEANPEESILEKKIINQLLYQIDQKRIPKTNFKIKKNDSTLKKILFAIFLTIFVASFLYIIFFNKISPLISDLDFNFFSFFGKQIYFFINLVIFLILLGILIYLIINLQKNKNIFKRIKYRDTEIHLNEKEENSYFNQYLSEVIYIFDNSNADVIVFEDLDRFENKNIFQHLREINVLINEKRKDNSIEPLRFFYLIKDDIFLSKDRTKFFDFIIPIVPVLDGSNSFDQFKKILKNANIYDEFDEYFLKDVSLYIDDMRILKNICNEFNVYNRRINTTEQDYDKLLSIIIYKNIFPKDYNETQLNKGFISRLFIDKKELIQKKLESNKEKLDEKNNELQEIKNEHLKNMNELNLLNRYKHQLSDFNYEERKKILEKKNENEINRIKSEINELEEEKNIINGFKLKELITRDNIDKIFNLSYTVHNYTNNFDDVKSNDYFDLLKYLVRNGYIDETYEDYTSYFYAESLSIQDKKFIRSITDQKPKQWDYEIKKPEKIIENLREPDFKQQEILNYYIFEFLLVNNQYKKYLELFMNQIKDSKNYEFIKNTFNKIENKKILIKKINKYWVLFLYEIINNNNNNIFEEEMIKEIILLTFYSVNKEDLENINKDNKLAEYISNNPKFLDIQNPDNKEIIKSLKTLNILFSSLNYSKSNKSLFNDIYKNNLYEVNMSNIKTIINIYYKNNNEEEILHKNYSIISSKNDSYLYNYIQNNIESYINLILDNCEERIEDNEETASEIINNENIDDDIKERYLKYLRTIISSLEKIENKKYWDMLIKYKIIKYSKENIFMYYFESNNKKTMDSDFIKYINSEKFIFKFTNEELVQKYEEENISSFFGDLVKCNDIDDENYRNILNNFHRYYTNVPPKNISKNHIKILIDLEIVKLRKEYPNIIDFFRNNYSENFIYFISKNISTYIDNFMGSHPLTSEEVINLLDENINDDYKERIISEFKPKISLENIEYSDELKIFILKNNYIVQSELKDIIENYEKEKDNIKIAINISCLKNLDYIINNEIELNKDILNFIAKEEIEDIKKVDVLINNNRKLSKEDFVDYFRFFDDKNYENIFHNNKRPKFDINEPNKKLLKLFISKKWIKEYHETNGVYRRKL